ncbi:MAG: C40 family peptidase [Prevotellaceae bacterium]|jgi:hypothetical protein|nr:C40 family peptidase [Prevotellaceae bacterium]
MFCIVNQILAPLREGNAETSEMVSQLLFGEMALVLEKRGNRLKISNCADGYEGWIDRRMVEMIDENETIHLSQQPEKTVCTAYALAKNKDNVAEKVIFPGGAIIRSVEGENGFKFQNSYYVFEKETDLADSMKPEGEIVLDLAKQYLHAPYLWGGKSIFGIDCSGLVQIVFSICGIRLPRDASQQVDKGAIVNFLSEARAGDLAFFEDRVGKIVHVGILVDNHRIIHASGRVKIDRIDNEGIYSSEKQDYSHRLRLVKRIL